MSGRFPDRRRRPAAVERFASGQVEPQVHRERPGGGGQPVRFLAGPRRIMLDIEVERTIGVEVQLVAVADREAAQWIGGEKLVRSEARRGGKELDRTCRSRWAPYN